MAILGAAGGIGQPLSLLMKSDAHSRIVDLRLYDIANMGMAADLAHIPTATRVRGYSGENELPLALDAAEVVIIPAGVPRKPGMTRDDLFNINASIVKSLVTACAKYCPRAHLLIISNPVNSTVPIAYETMLKAGVSRPSVFGVTTLDMVRARAFVGEAKGVDPAFVAVRVIGGHSGSTIVPLLSTARGPNGENFTFTKEERKMLVQRIQFGGDEVVKAKAGTGSATLSMAFAAKEFYDQFVTVLDGNNMAGGKPIAFVKTDSYPTGYFASELDLANDGSIVKVAKIEKDNIPPEEQELFQIALNDLAKDVRKGEEFVRSQ